MRITIDAFGEKELSRELLRFSARAQDMRPAFDEIHELFLEVEKEQFDTEGNARRMGKWKPLAASTVAYKARHHLDPRILHATLRLRNSLTERDSADHVYHSTLDEAVMMSTVPYGVYHQSREPRHHLPRRPPVEIPDVAKREWMKILQRHLVEGL